MAQKGSGEYSRPAVSNVRRAKTSSLIVPLQHVLPFNLVCVRSQGMAPPPPMTELRRRRRSTAAAAGRHKRAQPCLEANFGSKIEPFSIAPHSQCSQMHELTPAHRGRMQRR